MDQFIRIRSAHLVSIPHFISRVTAERVKWKAYCQALFAAFRSRRSTGMVQSPNFPMMKPYLDPDFNRTIPESREGKAGVYKELALFELFLRDSSRNSRNRQVIWLFVCVYQ